jgi:2,5-diketo-D-gluconate reductase A
MMLAVPTLSLNNGVAIPQLGFGVFQISPGQTEEAVATAIEAGYRLIDTAALYGNEGGVGRAIARCGVPRDQLFVTTKLGNPDQGYDAALRAFDVSLAKLGLDSVDLYLIHWPLPMYDQYVQTWKALETIYHDGRSRSIGVSNFTPRHLRRLFEETEVIPAVNQVELHPRFSHDELRAFHAEHGIITEAWSPLGQGKGLLANPTVRTLAAAKGRTAAQVVLRWHIQLGTIAIPKSVSPERIRSNLKVFDFALDDADLAMLSGLGP